VLRTLGLTLLLLAPSYAADSKDLKKAIDLPAKAQALRDAGVKPAQLEAALDAADDEGLGADEAEELLEASEKAVKDNGPDDNFGAFVKAKLDEGLRGRELAQAIKEEHARQGKGKGHDKGKGPPEGKGPPDDKGKGKGKGSDKGNKGKGKNK